MSLFSQRDPAEQVYTRYCALVSLADRRDKTMVVRMYRRVTETDNAPHTEGGRLPRAASHVSDVAVREAHRRLLAVEQCSRPHRSRAV